jgi:hypothetical protein
MADDPELNKELGALAGGSNGTQNWNICPLADSSNTYPTLRHLRIAQTRPAEHNRTIVDRTDHELRCSRNRQVRLDIPLTVGLREYHPVVVHHGLWDSRSTDYIAHPGRLRLQERGEARRIEIGFHAGKLPDALTNFGAAKRRSNVL